MLLSYRTDSFAVPHTSTCIIHTTGEIKDGDMIDISSPIFTSTNFISRAIYMKETFSVVARVSSGSVINNEPDGSFKGIIVCDDDDVFNMYVRIQ